MKHRAVQADDFVQWPDGARVVMHPAPGDEEEVEAAECLAEMGGGAIHVPWQPDELDVAALANGGTVWLTVLGGLAPHKIEVRGGGR